MSEEAEVKKNIEWLKEEIQKLPVKYYGFSILKHKDEYMVNKDEVIRLINQLDEPEVLSTDWVKNNQRMWASTHGVEYHVPANKLYGKVVPKQEKVKVDKEDAENIKDYKEEGWRLSHLINDTGADANHEELLAQAWLAYPNIEVEKEQKYRVIFPSVDENGKGFNYLAKDCYHKELWIEDTRTDGLAWEERSSFTEDEIRNLDKGDILFEHFAKPVEELEE